MGTGLLTSRPEVVNVGLDKFKDSIEAAGAAVVHTHWRPPARGGAELNRVLLALEAYYDQIH